MVPSGVHDHVCSRRHVAAHALRARTSRPVKVMIRIIELLDFMALRAKRIAPGLQPRGMRIVTIGTTHAFRGHLALQERSDFKDLFANLSIDEIQTILWKLRSPRFQHCFEHPFTGRRFPETDATRVACAALVHLGLLRSRHTDP